MPKLTTLFDFEDKTTKKLKRAVGTFEQLQRVSRKPVAIRAADYASRTVRGIDRSVNRLASGSYKVTVRSVDMASRTIGTIRRSLTSIPSIITVGLAVVGVDKLKDATLGAAMNFEQYEVSMDHWLKGNKKKSKELISWMGQFADKTPFNSADLFPALTRGVGIANGDIKQAKQLLSISSDMASLTPGKTVADAMEAIADAQMGEFERMKEFNLKMTQKQFKAIGGWGGFIKEINKKFEGGASKLSQTARGQISTLTGYIGTSFRQAGDGILTSMKPRLNKLIGWIDNNQDKWSEWKSTVQKAGQQGAEWIFSRFENGFKYIRSNYLENDDFKKLDFEGKIKFILGDINQWWNDKGKPSLSGWWNSTGQPWAETIGISMGKAIFSGLISGTKEGIKSIGGMWKEAFKDPSFGSFGGAAISTMLAASLGSMVLSPVFKGTKVLGKGAKGAWNLGKSVKNKLPGGSSKRGNPRNSSYNNHNKLQNKAPTSKMPKWLGTAGKGLKRVPLLGTAVGALSLIGASKQEKPKVAGGLVGGAAGAATGAAIGSIIPGIGTGIGGILGGILGSFGGEAFGDWLGEIDFKGMADKAKNMIVGSWDSISGWFTTNVSIPISKGFSSSINWVKSTWGTVSTWFNNTIWKPISSGVDTTINFMVGLFDIGREWISGIWSSFSDWFQNTVWNPISKGVSIVSDWIITKWESTKAFFQSIWMTVSGWFQQTVWTPIVNAVNVVGTWISTKFSEAWNWVSGVWSAVSGWFMESVWNPISTGVSTAATWIWTKMSEAWNWIQGVWGTVSGWFEETIWTPIKSATESIRTWIGEKFESAKTALTESWGALSGWFEESVWGPIKTGVTTVTSMITSGFETALSAVQSIWDGIKEIGGWIKGKWDDSKQWGNEVVERGKKVRSGEKTENNANGGYINKPIVSWIGEAGPEYVIPVSGNKRGRGRHLLSQAASALGMSVTDGRYANKGVLNPSISYDSKSSLSDDQISVATQSNSPPNNRTGGIRDIILQFTGENNYSNDMDAESVGKIAIKAIRKVIEDEMFGGGDGVYDV